MLIKKNFSLIIITIVFSSLMSSVNNLENTFAVSNDDLNGLTFSSNMLGMVDTSFDTHVGFWAIEYLDGSIYAVDGTTTSLYIYDAQTGLSTANISIPFISQGITTDGTDLYLSIYSFGSKNGTIVKMDITGTEISRIQVNVFDDHIAGLAWDGNYLWGFESASDSILRIDPISGAVSKNITVGYELHGMTWYDNKIWTVNFGIDRVEAINPITGSVEDGYASPFHHDSGIANNGTHMFESDYITELEVVISKMSTEPGEVFLRQTLSVSSSLDITYTGEYYFLTENHSTLLMRYNARTNAYSGVVGLPFQPVGITALDDTTLLIASEDAPYNLFTFTTAGVMLVNHSALDVMIVSLAFDGLNVWAMGHDNVLYKLNPIDMSIITEYSLEDFRGITYDYTKNVIWAISRAEHKIKYFDTVKEELGIAAITLQPPVASFESGLTFTGKYLVTMSYYSGNTYYYKIIPIDIDEEPQPTPTNSTTPGGLFPGVSPLIEDLIFLGIGIVGTSIIAIIIAIARRKKT
ncbi:MAG TPA: hypothetical protein VMZ29_07275 [Candidatus Bathyarchaeia archaeon]|nr:hypothetical protein [Candidatus Bathyarchaeia archaeon]